MPTEEIVVLASSKKLGGRCVAGISINSGAWVRPVSNFGEGELYPHQCRVDGRLPSPLDVVEFAYVGPVEDPAQPENVLVADEAWRLTETLDPVNAYDRLTRFLSPGPGLFGNRGKAVDEEVAAAGLAASLELVEPSGDVEFSLEPPFKPGGPSRTRVTFSLAGQTYDLPVTDFWVRPRLLKLEFGRFSPEQVGLDPARRLLLTVSLGGAKFGAHWKLVAAVLSIS